MPGCICALVSGLVLAAPGTANKRVSEASMLVTGTIVFAPDGSVRSYALDKPEKLSPAIKAFVGNTVAAWRFVPVVAGGQPITTQTRMHLRLITAPAEDGTYVMRVGGASFTGGVPGEHVQSEFEVLRQVPPKYPPGALQARVGATVYLAVKVGRQRQVLEAAAVQVNLDTSGTARQMTGLRDAFAKASVSAALLWTYPPANSVLHPDDSYLIARVPVTFSINQPRARADDGYGRWQPYVPGPREVVPWLDVAQSATDGVDTAPQRSVLPLAQGPQLASPPTRNRSHVRGLNGQFEQRWR